MIRSAAYRIATIYSAAFALATLALGIGVYWAADLGLRGQLDDRIAAEVSSLVSEYRGEGAASLRTVIGHRETARATNRLGYALFARDGRRVAGQLEAKRPPAGWGTIAFRDPIEGTDGARAFAFDLSDGERLVVAADWDELKATEHLIVSLLAVAFIAVLAIGAIGALLLGAYLRRRLSTISAAAEEIAAGDLTQRIAISPRRDEFDRLSLALNSMLDRIADLLGNLRQVSGDIAHDLRTPLTRLRTGLEAGLDSTAPREVIGQAIERSDEVLALFGAILRVSEIEAGGLRQAFAPVALDMLTREIVESYQPAIEDGGRSLVATIADGVDMSGDRELVAQALINLLDNAQIHTPHGTQIAVALTVESTSVRLAVADDGPGVAAADRERIVQRFVRTEASRTRPGHGLGLSLVAAITRMHGGTLTVADNMPGLAVAMDFPR